jgi:hypothetical protein
MADRLGFDRVDGTGRHPVVLAAAVSATRIELV